MYSVIIPAKNESKNIARCIRSVFNCVEDRDLVEIIVVDNGSSDDTAKLAEQEGATVYVLKQANVASLRNFGVTRSRYDIIGFIDADCEAMLGWLDNAKKLLHDPNVGIVGDYPRLPENPCWIEKAWFSCLLRSEREVSYLGGCNMVMRRSTFVGVGEFDENTITGEDYVLGLKVKKTEKKVIADPSVAVIHYGNPRTLCQLFEQEVWRGLGMFDLCRYGKITLPLTWANLNILLIGGIITGTLLGKASFTLSLILLFWLLPLGAALHRSVKKESHRYLFSLYIIFVVYGLARTVSILKLGSRYVFSIMRV